MTKRGPQPEDLSGQLFGKLEVIEYAGKVAGRNAWKCKCECGNETVVGARHLKYGDVISCGCQLGVTLKEHHNRDGAVKHGHARAGAKTPTYLSWRNMHSRCRYPKNVHYHRYGGRGIVVCERWSDFQNFLEDMGPKPSQRHQISRLDHDGNYEPSNCEWALIGTH